MESVLYETLKINNSHLADFLYQLPAHSTARLILDMYVTGFHLYLHPRVLIARSCFIVLVVHQSRLLLQHTRNANDRRLIQINQVSLNKATGQ